MATARRRIGLLTASALAAAALAAPGADARTVAGTVVDRSATKHSFVVADGTGRLYAMRGAQRTPTVGRAVVVAATPLPSGRYRARRVRIRGVRRAARLVGVVTWIDRGAGAFAVSSRAVSVVVRRPPSKLAHAAIDRMPEIGSRVRVTAAVDRRHPLAPRDVVELGAVRGAIELAGVVAGIDAAGRFLRITADGDGHAHGTVAVHVPDALDLAAFPPGRMVELAVSRRIDGVFELVRGGIARNRRS